MKKPSFNVSKDERTVRVNGKVYSLELVGPGNFLSLLDASRYERGFSPATCRETVDFLHALFLSRELDDLMIKKFYQSMQDPRGLFFNTVVYRGVKGAIIAIDRPKFEEGDIKIDDVQLRSTRGVKIGNVGISNDGLLRAMSDSYFYNESGGMQRNVVIANAFQVMASDLPVLYTGDKESPMKLADLLDFENRYNKSSRCMYFGLDLDKKINLPKISQAGGIGFGGSPNVDEEFKDFAELFGANQVRMNEGYFIQVSKSA